MFLEEAISFWLKYFSTFLGTQHSKQVKSTTILGNGYQLLFFDIVSILPNMQMVLMVKVFDCFENSLHMPVSFASFQCEDIILKKGFHENYLNELLSVMI